MKIKKRIYPFLLVLAILLTLIGLVSANVSFSVPMQTNKTFNINIDNVNTNNIEVIGYDNTNITYLLNLNSYTSEYEVTFDVYNTSDFNAVLANKTITDIPVELQDIIIPEVLINNRVEANKYDTVTIRYNLKNDLTKEEKQLLDKNKELKVSVLLNYNQE